jgi:hypothetical protein
MPKAGIYTYPVNDIDSVLIKLRKFYDVAKTDSSDRSIFAESLGMSEKGGGFANMISDIEKYGLVELGGGKVKITERGKLALFGTETERDQARSTAVSNIDIFREIFRLYGASPSIEQIKAFLRQKANVDVVEVQNLAPKIDTIYKKVSNYITTADKPDVAPTPITEASGSSPVPNIGRRDMVIPDTTTSKVQPLKVQFGDVYIQVPADANSLESIKLAKDMLDFMMQRLQKERETTQHNS